MLDTKPYFYEPSDAFKHICRQIFYIRDCHLYENELSCIQWATVLSQTTDAIKLNLFTHWDLCKSCSTRSAVCLPSEHRCFHVIICSLVSKYFIYLLLLYFFLCLHFNYFHLANNFDFPVCKWKQLSALKKLYECQALFAAFHSFPVL